MYKLRLTKMSFCCFQKFKIHDNIYEYPIVFVHACMHVLCAACMCVDGVFKCSVELCTRACVCLVYKDVVATLLYGSECWAVKATAVHHLVTVHNHFVR